MADKFFIDFTPITEIKDDSLFLVDQDKQTNSVTFNNIKESLSKNLFKGNFTENGHIYIGSLLIQWGYVPKTLGITGSSPSLKSINVKFNIPYNTKCFNLQLTKHITSLGSGIIDERLLNNDDVFLQTITLSDFRVSYQIYDSLFWLAIGI